MTWEEHEEEYGIIVKDIPKGIYNQDLRIYGVAQDYSSASGQIDGLDYEYEGRVSFECVKNSTDGQWYIINKDDLNKLEII
jgi:hypothetical protein